MAESEVELDLTSFMLYYRKDNGEKSDVYDLGTILLEVIVGRPIDSQDDVTVSRDIVSVKNSIYTMMHFRLHKEND